MKNTVVKKTVIVATVAILALSCLLGLCACNETKVERYAVNKADTSVMGYGGSAIVGAVFNIALDEENTYLELDNKGNLHFQIRTKQNLFGDITKLLSSLGAFGLNISMEQIGEMLGNFDIKGGVDTMVEPMFPGFRAKLEQGDLDGALKLIQRSLGFYLYGLDYNNENVKDALKYVGENMKLPSNLLEIIPADTQLTLTFDSKYYRGEVKGEDGQTYEAIFVGDLGENPYTQPFGVFTGSTNNDGKKVYTLRIEFMNVQVSFVAK